MPIQFACPGCAQPIEVDDEFARQQAQCPYCHAVVAVPEHSTLPQTPPVTVRPVAVEGPPGELPPPGFLHVGGELTPRQIAARRYGNFGLVATLLTIGLLAAAMIRSFSLAVGDGLMASDTPPGAEEIRRVSERMAADALVPALLIGVMFFALVGFVLGVVSLSQDRRLNWRAWIAVSICGGLLACLCSSAILPPTLATPPQVG